MKTIWIEISIIVMFITGILQWDVVDMEWEYFALIQAIHIISSIIVSVVLIIPFVNMHTYKYRKKYCF